MYKIEISAKEPTYTCMFPIIGTWWFLKVPITKKILSFITFTIIFILDVIHNECNGKILIERQKFNSNFVDLKPSPRNVN